MKKRLVITPHADDATIFAGGQIALWANAGDSVTILRITNDDFDSAGMSIQETIENNKQETQRAYRALGAETVIDFGYQSDYLHQADYTALRAALTQRIREIRPYTVLAPDRDTLGEDNMDHVIVANACAEALWQSSFALHCPTAGAEPYSVPERLLYSRNPSPGYSYIDISSVMGQKISAICLQPTPISKMLDEAAMRARAMGISIYAGKERSLQTIITESIKKLNAAQGAAAGFAYAERIKNQGYGLLEMFL